MVSHIISISLIFRYTFLTMWHFCHFCTFLYIYIYLYIHLSNDMYHYFVVHISYLWEIYIYLHLYNILIIFRYTLLIMWHLCHFCTSLYIYIYLYIHLSNDMLSLSRCPYFVLLSNPYLIISYYYYYLYSYIYYSHIITKALH